ncbi:unnamed protein product [Rhizophagus irregularis]|nr:unnamed protein product [Rhizophagus irregularis]
MIPKNASNQSPSRPLHISSENNFRREKIFNSSSYFTIRFGRCKELYCYGVVFPSPQIPLPQQTSSSPQLCPRSPQPLPSQSPTITTIARVDSLLLICIIKLIF